MRDPVRVLFLWFPLHGLIALMTVLGGAGDARAVPLAMDPQFEAAVTGDWGADPATLSDGVATARLQAGILCAAWARDMIGQHWRRLDHEDGPGTWSADRQTLWFQLGWIAEFERRYLRPRIDAESQEALQAAWWPEGVSTQAGSSEAAQIHRFCLRLPGLFGSIDPDAPPRDPAMLR
ncbi:MULTISPECIES: hypothetical protein [Rhodovulum]|uniref:Uncharacterized protein n=2 Tax=Rhodovulum TaxID=34008 RepID=A0A8E2VLL6_9RHOB|nr:MULTISPECIES: hypothetical protein [Rhodovulum]PTW51225.1 hypothetical protein C8N38_10215 [Rhodovulum kholense]RAP41027.1 hypothetical protein BYZ73_12585 [Rhodovulum viride]